MVWETTTTFPDLQEVRSYSSSHIALSDAPSGEVLTGSNLQAGSQVPVYYLKLFDALGENVTNFTSVNTQLSAFAHFLNDEQIIVIGCGLNSASTGPDDLCLLNYEIYDLSGNLVTEITNTLPYEISLSGIENLGMVWSPSTGEFIKMTTPMPWSW